MKLYSVISLTLITLHTIGWAQNTSENALFDIPSIPDHSSISPSRLCAASPALPQRLLQYPLTGIAELSAQQGQHATELEQENFSISSSDIPDSAMPTSPVTTQLPTTPIRLTSPLPPELLFDSTADEQISHFSLPKLSPRKLPTSYLCALCLTTWKKKADYTKHMRTHNGEKPYTCSICSKGFSQSSNRNSHMRVHSNQKPHICPVCKKRFKTKEGQKRHMHNFHLVLTASTPLNNPNLTEQCLSSVRKLKSYPCPSCEKICKQKGDLDKHMRTHTGEKPFKCSTCSRTFAYKSNLTKHIRTHTGEKPYTCTSCNRSFSDKSSLNRHIRNKHPQGT